MQDEINEKTIALYIKTGKLTAQTLQKAMKTLLAQMKKQKDKTPQGKQTLKQLTKQEKTTDIWFDEKEPTIYIRTHNTDLKNRLAAYAAAHPGECRQTDADPETGCMEFEIAKGRFSFRLTAPYSEERRRATSEAAKKCGVHRKITHLYGDSN